MHYLQKILLRTEPRPQHIFSLSEEGKNCSGDEVVTGTHSKIKVEMY